MLTTEGVILPFTREVRMTELTPISTNVLDALRRASTATITTQLFQRGFHNLFLNGVQPLNPDHCRFVGEAVTLRNIPMREDLDRLEGYRDPEHPQRKAVEMVGPGQVLVMDCRGDLRGASGGNILMTRLRVKGAAGVVSDGSMRDSPEIEQNPFPVFCGGRSANLSLIVHHAVDVNVPIACAGVPVFPGDIVVGDAEGVVVIPRHLAAEIAEPAANQEALEQFILQKVEGGAALPGTYPPNEQTLAEYESWKQQSSRT
jgi:regulator of RNase E activity RraA